MMVSSAQLSAVLRESLRAVVRNKTRSALSIIGITIGIAAVVWVVAIGRSGSERAEDQLRALGDNLVWVEAGSRNVNGVRTGNLGMTNLTIEDVQAILSDVPLIRSVSPQMDGNVGIAYGNRNWSTRYRGVAPEYLDIRRWQLADGATFREQDVEQAANVCIIGWTVRNQIFGSEDPVGRIVRITGRPFEVVGVLASKGQSATGQDQDDTIFVPYTTAQKKFRLTFRRFTLLNSRALPWPFPLALPLPIRTLPLP